MKAELLKRLHENSWASLLPGFKVRGHLLYAVPCESVLRGFYFDSSGWSKSRVYVTAFAQPLYVPNDHVILSYGKRLHSGSHFWELNDETPKIVLDELTTLLASDGVKFLQHRATPRLIADAYRWEATLHRDPHVRQLVAFSLAKAKELGRASRLLNRLRHPQRGAPEWERVIASQCQTLLSAMERGPDEADLQLTKWENETRLALTLPQ